MGWRRREMETTCCSSFLFIPLLLLLPSLSPTFAATDSAAGKRSVRPTHVASDAAAAAAAAAGTVSIVQGWCPNLEEEGRPRWWSNESDSECELADGETEEALGMDSLANQQLLGMGGYINYHTLKKDIPQCQKKGNCRPTAASPKPSTRCTGWCRRDYSPVQAATY